MNFLSSTKGKSVIFFIAMRILFLLYTPLAEDIGLYKQYAKRIMVGGELNFYLYNDVEYPGLAITIISIPGYLAARYADPNFYGLFFHLLMFVFDVVGFLFFLSILTHLTKNKKEYDLGMYWYALVFFLLPDLIYSRMDMVLNFLLIFAFWLAIVKKRIYLSMVALALAVNFKLIPIVLVPFFALVTVPSEYFRGRFDLKALFRLFISFLSRLGVLTVSISLIFVPYYLQIGPLAWRFLRFHLERGIHIESIIGSFYILRSFFGLPVSIQHTFSSYNVLTPMAHLNTYLTVALLMGLSAVFVFIFFCIKKIVSHDQAQGPFIVNYPHASFKFILLVFCVAIAISKVFSPQYLIWLIPLVVLAELKTKGRYQKVLLSVFVLVIISTTVLWPYAYQSLVKLQTFGRVALLVRNTIFIVFLGLLVRQAWAGTKEKAHILE